MIVTVGMLLEGEPTKALMSFVAACVFMGVIARIGKHNARMEAQEAQDH